MPLLQGRLPALRTKKPASLQIDDFNGGVNLLFSETRLKKNEAREATNLMLIEDGIWDKRWGTDTKITMGSTVDGFTEYIKSDLTRELIICSGGTIYKSTDLSTTASISGATYTSGNKCFFIQIGSNLYIGNGVDALIRYNGTSLSTYTALSNPGTVTPTRGSGLSAGAWTYYYKVTAVNAVGETSASAEASITVNKDRDTWTNAATENIVLDWADVTGALKYVVYFADTTGFEVKLAETTASTYTDDGTAVPNPYIEPPSANTTGGPELKVMWLSGNRIWGTEPDNPYRVYFSGSGVYLGNFSPAYGGGWIELEKGGRAVLVGGVDFQGKSHAICETPEGRGTIWEIVLENQSISGTDTSYIVPVPTKIIGSVGSNASRSIVIVENDVWMTNKNGATILGNEPGVLNVLRTNETSAKLRPYFRTLDAGSISKICSYYYDGKVFISVPTASGDPNKIIYFDRERLGWVKDWSIGVSQFGEFTDTDKTTHLLGSNGTKIIEFSSVYTDDDGTAFAWKYLSPRLPVAGDWTLFGKIKKAYVKLRNTQGSIDFSFAGTGKNRSFSTLKSGTITPGSSDSGIGWDLMGAFLMGSTSGTPSTFSDESLIRFLKINKLIRDMQWEVEGDAANDRAVITGLMAKGFVIGGSDPSDWKLD